MTIGQIFRQISETKGREVKLCEEAERIIRLHKEKSILTLCLKEAKRGKKVAYLGKLVPPNLETESIFWIKSKNMQGLIACWDEPQ